jgi:hypothetical protein
VGKNCKVSNFNFQPDNGRILPYEIREFITACGRGRDYRSVSFVNLDLDF